MLSFLTHKDKPARGWGFTWCSREAAGEVTLLELGVRVVPSPSSEDKQWRARQSSFLEAGTGERGRVERRGCSGSDKGGPVSWGLREDKASRREMWICCCASVDVTAQGWGWEDWSSCFPKKGAPRLKLLPSGLVEWRRGLQEDETTLHFLPFFFFFPRKKWCSGKGRNAWRQGWRSVKKSQKTSEIVGSKVHLPWRNEAAPRRNGKAREQVWRQKLKSQSQQCGQEAVGEHVVEVTNT